MTSTACTTAIAGDHDTDLCGRSPPLPPPPRRVPRALLDADGPALATCTFSFSDGVTLPLPLPSESSPPLTLASRGRGDEHASSSSDGDTRQRFSGGDGGVCGCVPRLRADGDSGVCDVVGVEEVGDEDGARWEGACGPCRTAAGPGSFAVAGGSATRRCELSSRRLSGHVARLTTFAP